MERKKESQYFVDGGYFDNSHAGVVKWNDNRFGLKYDGKRFAVQSI